MSILAYIAGYLLTFIGQVRMASIDDISVYMELLKRFYRVLYV